MTSTLDITPWTTTRGAVSNAEPATTTITGPTATESAFWRASQPDYHQWLDHVQAAAGCTHPIQLAGEIVITDTATGQLLATTHTDSLPDRRIYKACGNRRATVCPSCAETYRRDAYQLIHTGLVGGKGVTPGVAKHPALFVTLTAPGFGTVHTRRTSKIGRALPCRPRRKPDPCPHGIDLRCHRIHADGEHILGTPLCLDCYDYPAHLIWNDQARELWRRTRINLDRQLRRHANHLGLLADCVKLRYAKVAEMQRRGVVHFHLVIRLDGIHPELPGLILPPPNSSTSSSSTRSSAPLSRPPGSPPPPPGHPRPLAHHLGHPARHPPHSPGWRWRHHRHHGRRLSRQVRHQIHRNHRPRL